MAVLAAVVIRLWMFEQGMDAMNSRWAAVLPLQGLQFFIGASVAMIMAQIATVWATVCGTSSEALIALLLACGAAALTVRIFVLTRFHSTTASLWTATLLLLICSAGLPPGLDTTLTLAVSVFGDHPTLCFGVPAVLTAAMFAVFQCWAVGVREWAGDTNGTTVAGFCVGLLFPLVHAAGMIAVAVPVSVSILTTMAFWFVAQRFQQDAGAGRLAGLSRGEREDVDATTRQHAAAGHLQSMRSQSATLTVSESSDSSFHWLSALSTVGLALFIHSVTRYVSALMPITFVVLLPAVALTSLVWAALSIRQVQSWFTRSRPAIVAMILPVAIPLAFISLVEWNLKLNATLDSVTLLFAARCLQLAMVWSVGVIVWKVANQQIGTGRQTLSVSFAFGCFGLVTGIVLSGLSLPIPAGMALGLLLAASGLFRTKLLSTPDDVSSHTIPRTRIQRIFAAACVVAVLVAILPLDTGSATQLLFSARAAQGFRAGLSPDVINQSTGFRLVSEQQSGEGHLTVWRTSGDQMQLRRDSIPLGQISANTLTTPQPIADTLPVLLPLVMHKNASSILLLGDETGSGLRVCSDFPVHTVVACRPDPATTEFAEQYTWRTMQTSPLQDDRFHIRSEPVALTVRQPLAASDRFDVVVAVSPNPTSVSCLEQLTPEFYAAVRNQLTDHGVFCQRITRHDLGAVPLFRIISSVSAEFGRVVMLHMAQGEIAVVAGVQPDSLLDKHLLTRMQRDHVGRVLSQSGWDWSQVAALPAIDTNDPVGIFEHQEKLAAASATNAHFTFALPLQAAAWTDRMSELRATFAPHQQRMADAAVRGPGYDEFARRFSAVVQQAEILATFPDQPWPYRRSLRTEMQRNPRPPIEKVRNGKVERIADPRDNWRKDYFVALGTVLQQAKTGAVDPLALRTLTNFTARYEPLLSYFAHHELVRIHEAAGHPGPALELRHRLHAVYFTEGSDFSVRQITDAMEQILEDPELVADAATRFDYVNSMLQELVRRWELRRNYEPPSACEAQADIDSCIVVAKRALDALQEWSEFVGMSHDEILARRKFINKGLISPLRTYSEQVLAHRMKNEIPMSVDPAGKPGELPMLINPEELLTN